MQKSKRNESNFSSLPLNYHLFILHSIKLGAVRKKIIHPNESVDIHGVFYLKMVCSKNLITSCSSNGARNQLCLLYEVHFIASRIPLLAGR